MTTPSNKEQTGAEQTSPEQGNTRNTGPGRLLIAVYGVFALAATARAAYQIATKFHTAPLAYLLSALAAVVYIVATVSLARKGTASFRVSVVAVSLELLGVLVVGALGYRPRCVPLLGVPGGHRMVRLRQGLRFRAAAAAAARPLVAVQATAGRGLRARRFPPPAHPVFLTGR